MKPRRLRYVPPAIVSLAKDDEPHPWDLWWVWMYEASAKARVELWLEQGRRMTGYGKLIGVSTPAATLVPIPVLSEQLGFGDVGGEP